MNQSTNPAPDDARYLSDEAIEHVTGKSMAYARKFFVSSDMLLATHAAADFAWDMCRAEALAAAAGLVAEIDCLLDYMDEPFVSEVVTGVIAERIRAQRALWDQWVQDSA